VVTKAEDNTALVWDLRGPRPTFVALEGHQGAILSASFSPDGTHVVTADAAEARVWDLRGPQPTFVALEGHQGASGHNFGDATRRRLTTRRGCGAYFA